MEYIKDALGPGLELAAGHFAARQRDAGNKAQEDGNTNSEVTDVHRAESVTTKTTGRRAEPGLAIARTGMDFPGVDSIMATHVRQGLWLFVTQMSLLGVLCVGGSGCGPHETIGRAPDSATDAGDPPSPATVETAPANELSVTADDLYPVGPMTKIYEQRDATGRSKSVTFEKREISAKNGDGAWTITFFKPANGAQETPPATWEMYQRLTLRKNAGGDVEMILFEDLPENARMEYQPAIIIAPARLTSAAAFDAKATCVLKSHNRPERERDRGGVTQHVEVVGQPTDGQPGVRVRSKLVANLSLAKITRERDQLVTPGKGGRYEIDSKVVKVGMMTWESTKRTLTWDEGLGK